MSLDRIFKANDDVNIDSERLLLSARNGASFVEKNKMVFQIDSDFVSLKNCYLHFDVDVDSSSLYRFDSSAQDLIKSIRITEKNTGRVIESISDYNVLAANMFDYTLRSGKKDAKTLTELARKVEPLNGHNNINDILYPPFAKPYKDGVTPVSAAKGTNKQRVVLELYSGLFSKDEETIYPGVLAPLQIEVELETNKRALVISDCINPDLITDASVKTITIKAPASGSSSSITLQNSTTTQNSGVINGMKGSPFTVGDKVSLADADGTNVATLNYPEITSITITGNDYVLGFATQTMPTKSAGSLIFLAKATMDQVTYTVTNPALEVCKVNVPNEWVNQIVDLVGSDEFRFNISAFENVQVNQPSSSTSFVNYINSNAQSVTGVLTIPTDSSTADSYTNKLIKGRYPTGGYEDTNYFYNGAPNPNLPVPLNKIVSNRLQQQHLHELQKFYDSIGKPVRDLSKFKDNFCVARAMSVYNGSLPLTGRDLSCRFNVVQGQNLEVNTLFNNYLYKNLQLVINKNGVQIIG